MRNGSADFNGGAADRLHRTNEAPARRTLRCMDRDDQMFAFIELAGGEGCEEFFRGVMRDCHFGSSSKSLRRFIANLILDFTVPSGMRSASAISECGRSSTNDIRIAADCSLERRERAAAIRAAVISPGDLRLLRVGRIREIFEFRVRHGDTGAGRSPHRVDPQVAGDREDPGRRACGSGIELRSLPPHRKQGILRDLLGFFAAGPCLQHQAFHARGKMLKQQPERVAVAMRRDAPDQFSPLHFCFGPFVVVRPQLCRAECPSDR